MLLAFVCGIERIEIFEVCVTISALIHYFSLVAMMWLAAEAFLMFQKLIVMFKKTSVAYFVIVSLICWRKFLSKCLLRLFTIMLSNDCYSVIIVNLSFPCLPTYSVTNTCCYCPYWHR